jgi:hypothetical protein
MNAGVRQRMPDTAVRKEPTIDVHLLRRCLAGGRTTAQRPHWRLRMITKPATDSPFGGTLADLVRTKPQLVTENALLRRQLIILRRSAKQLRCTRVDRALLVLLAARVRSWR